MLSLITENPQSKLGEYEITEFICRENNFSQRKKAYKVGNWLLVSFTVNNLYKIYRADTGKPFSCTIFSKSEDAVRIAQVISNVFEQYFDLWAEYPNVDVVSLAKWSVKNGIEICEILKSMPTKVNSMEDVKAIENSKSLKERISEWLGLYRKETIK